MAVARAKPVDTIVALTPLLATFYLAVDTNQYRDRIEVSC